MIIYGRNAVDEAIRGPRSVTEIWATTGAQKEPWLAGAGIRVHTQSGDEIAARCGSDGHQGICAEVSEYRYLDGEQLLDGGGREIVGEGGSPAAPLIIALDQVQDPQNLGAISRSAECAGASGLVLPERRAAEVTPAVCKASAGAVEHLPLAQVRNLTDFLTAAKDKGFWVYGADGDADMDYRTVDFTGPVVLVMGSEGKGLRPRVAKACDALISLPLRGRIESLSVGAAAAVLLYAAAGTR
jgi:23S rRNA (guanosine2251-2'-O)-methyltransferase